MFKGCIYHSFNPAPSAPPSPFLDEALSLTPQPTHPPLANGFHRLRALILLGRRSSLLTIMLTSGALCVSWENNFGVSSFLCRRRNSTRSAHHTPSLGQCIYVPPSWVSVYAAILGQYVHPPFSVGTVCANIALLYQCVHHQLGLCTVHTVILHKCNPPHWVRMHCILGQFCTNPPGVSMYTTLGQYVHHHICIVGSVCTASWISKYKAVWGQYVHCTPPSWILCIHHHR